MKKLSVAAALLLLFCGFSLRTIGQAQKENQLLPFSPAQWREDLQYFAHELPKRHKNLFHTISRDQFEQLVAELETALPKLTDYQIAVRMLQITAQVGDAHTYVHLPSTFKRYPLVFYWFGNELRVIRATKEYQDTLGTKVVSVGGLNIAAVQQRLLTVNSQDENEWFLLHNSPANIATPEILQTLGIVPDVSRAAFTFEADEGRQFTIEVVPIAADANLNSLLLGIVKSQPLYRQRLAEQFWFTYLPDAQTVYVNFKSYDSLGDNVRKLFQLIDSNPTRKLIIDIRQNGGGDFTKVRNSFIPGIKAHPAINRKGQLFIITGRRTFSAAMTNAIDFRKETKAILVGEPPGERPNGYQENDELKLPNSHLVVSYATRYYKFLDEDAPAVLPDKRIDPTWADFLAGRDPVLDWILAYRAD